MTAAEGPRGAAQQKTTDVTTTPAGEEGKRAVRPTATAAAVKDSTRSNAGTKDISRSCQTCFGVMMYTSNMLKQGASPECFGIKGKRRTIRNDDVRLRETIDREVKKQSKLRHDKAPPGVRTPVNSEATHMVFGYSQAFCQKDGDKYSYVGPYCIYGVNVHMVTKTRTYRVDESGNNNAMTAAGGKSALEGRAGAMRAPVTGLTPGMPSLNAPHQQQQQPSSIPSGQGSQQEDLMAQLSALRNQNEPTMKELYETAKKLGDSVKRFWTVALTGFGGKFEKSSGDILRQTTTLPGRMSVFMEKWRDHVSSDEPREEKQ